MTEVESNNQEGPLSSEADGETDGKPVSKAALPKQEPEPEAKTEAQLRLIEEAEIAKKKLLQEIKEFKVDDKAAEEEEEEDLPILKKFSVSKA